MSNRFCNLVGTNKIKDEYSKINSGFDIVQTEQDAQNTRISQHVAGSAEKHGTNEIDNDSGVTGATATAALNALKSQMDTLVVGAGNTTIGVFSMSGTGVNTITATFATLTYFTDLKVRLTTAGPNTGAATLNINSIGAKAIKAKKEDGTKIALVGGELPPLADLVYDGTDFLLMNSAVSEYSASATTTQAQTTISTSAYEGRMNVELRGNTVVNFVKNGNFTSTTGWTASSATISVSGNELAILADGTSEYPMAKQVTTMPAIENDKIYVRGLLRVSNSSALFCHLGLRHTNDTVSVGIVTKSTPSINVWNLLSGVITVPAGAAGTISVREFSQYADAATASGKTMYAKEVMAINLTNMFGAGSEPSAATCDLMFSQWFSEGGMSTDKVLTKITGKNLFNVKAPISASTDLTYSIDGEKLTISSPTSAYRYLSYRVRLKPNTQYVMSRVRTRLAGTDANVGEIEGCVDGGAVAWPGDGTVSSSLFITYNTTSDTFISPSDGIITIKIFSTRGTSEATSVEFSNIQIEEGSVATTYEPYTETLVPLPNKLRKMNSVVYDRFLVNEGKHIKNVSEWFALDGSLSWGLNADHVGYKSISGITFPLAKSSSDGGVQTILKYNSVRLTNGSVSVAFDYGRIVNVTKDLQISVSDADSGWPEAWDGATSFTGLSWGNLIKAYMNGWKLTTADLDVANCIWTGIVSGTTKTGLIGYDFVRVTNNVDVGFTPYKMTYQLATAVVTDYWPNQIKAKQGGCIHSHPFTIDWDVYDNGFKVSDTTKPISELAYINKINIQTGELTPIRIPTTTVASGGLSAASTALSNGDYIDFGYYHNDSVIPDILYSYPLNVAGAVDGATKDIAEINKEIQNIKAYERLKPMVASLVLGAVSATLSQAIFIAPIDCRLTDCKIVNKNAIGTSDTNYWTIALVDKGADGSASNTIVSKTTKVTGGTAVVAYDAYDLGVLDSTHRELLAGDVVVITFTKTSSPTDFAEALALLSYIPTT